LQATQLAHERQTMPSVLPGDTRVQAQRPARSLNNPAMIQKLKCGTNEDVDPAKP
jgi:hypothetical protein